MTTKILLYRIRRSGLTSTTIEVLLALSEGPARQAAICEKLDLPTSSASTQAQLLIDLEWATKDADGVLSLEEKGVAAIRDVFS